MNAFFYALMSLAIAATNVSAIGETMTCTTYSASPKGFGMFICFIWTTIIFYLESH